MLTTLIIQEMVVDPVFFFMLLNSDLVKEGVAQEHEKQTAEIVGMLAMYAPSGRAFGSGKGPHTAQVTVVRNGEVVYNNTFDSRNMTADEAALGFPQSTLATHSEYRAANQVPLQSGDVMTIQGQYPPCPSCIVDPVVKTTKRQK